MKIEFEFCFQLGLIHFTLTGIEFMRKDGGVGHGGTIVNVVSDLGYLPYIGCPIYSASKHAALGFLKSLAEEKICAQTGLKFVTICPGYTDTKFISDQSILHPFLFKATPEPYPPQRPEVVADCLIKSLKNEKFSSFWQCKNGEINEVELLGARIIK